MARFTNQHVTYNSAIQILDAHENYEDFIAEHPTGSPGDAHLVGTHLYSWNPETEEWIDAGEWVGPQGETGPAGADGEDGITPVIPITSRLYVDFKRSDSYTEVGSREFPFKTLASAVTAGELIATSANPITIVLLSNNSVAENVTLVKGHLFITGENSSGVASPIIFTGSMTFTGDAGSISANHFALSKIELSGVSGTDVITFSGTNPQRLFINDVWVTANGEAHGINMINTGGSTINALHLKLSHNGSGHFHCFHAVAGTANIEGLDTSGANVGILGIDGGSVNLNNSQVLGGGAYAIDVYAGGSLSAANCTVTTTAADSDGIILRAAGSVAIIGNISFNVPVSATGRAIAGVAGSVLYYGPMYFLPDGFGGTMNQKVAPAITALPINSTMDRS